MKTKVCKHMTAVSKNVYFEVLNIIIDKYNKTFYIKIQYDTIKIHLQMLDLILMLNTMLNLMKKILDLKLMIM